MELTREQIAAVAERKRQDYEAVIGLEVHVQLKTESKIFCGCSTRFGDPPNSNVCPVCTGLPGALPVLNHRAVELAVRAALALNCRVRPASRFARKNYFYPDLPKGYQISQFEEPLAEHGRLEIELDDGSKRIGITRLHLEEDAGKSLHEGLPESDEKTYLDFNRCGVPLVEIVSEPDLRAPPEAYNYLVEIQHLLRWNDISDCDMEKGSLRCDANVSVRPRGAEAFGVKTEVKNLNSFRYVARALEYEIDRQIALLENGGRVEQETRLWNVAAGQTEPMRSKEFAHDYRYFPEPDLLPLVVEAGWREELGRQMPEQPAARKRRFIEQYAITDYDAEVLTGSRALADYFEAAAKASPNPKAAANWIQAELLAVLKERSIDIERSPVRTSELAELIQKVEDGTLSGKMAKVVFKKLAARPLPTRGQISWAELEVSDAPKKAVEEIIAAEGLEQLTDTAAIEKICRDVLAKNPDKVAQYKRGKTALFGFFVGQVMKASQGRANPQQVNAALKQFLGG